MTWMFVSWAVLFVLKPTAVISFNCAIIGREHNWSPVAAGLLTLYGSINAGVAFLVLRFLLENPI